jgi:hypothetical protein
MAISVGELGEVEHEVKACELTCWALAVAGGLRTLQDARGVGSRDIVISLG